MQISPMNVITKIHPVETLILKKQKYLKQGREYNLVCGVNNIIRYMF